MNLILLNAEGVLVPAKDPSGVMVIDPVRNLMWSAARIVDRELREEEAHAAARDCRLGGFGNWRVPEVGERLSISDFSRCDPALNTDYFQPCTGWERTATGAAWSSADAWFVHSYSGHPVYYFRHFRAWLRVCRSVSPVAAGQ